MNKKNTALTLGAGLFLLSTALSAAESQAATQSFVVIVANNQSLTPDRATLRYADDDGARYAEFFELSAEQVELYSVLDADTQALFPERAAKTLPPKREVILKGLSSIFDEIQKANQAGHKTIFYFLFSGHGDLAEDGAGYVHFLDSRWTRSDLYEHVIAASPATFNHVIVDACNAYFLVASRGEQAEDAGDFSELLSDFARQQDIKQHPNTGVVLATSRATEVHEWSKIQAGVFSHQIRSALSGAADANGDAKIDYDELGAWIAAANGALKDAKTRLQVFAKAPAQNLSEPLSTLPTEGAELRLPESIAGHFFVEDDRGVRQVDINKTSESAVTLHLVSRPVYYLRDRTSEYRLENTAAGGMQTLAMLTPHALPFDARASAQDAFDSSLFQIAFGPAFVSGWKGGLQSAPALPVALLKTSPQKSLTLPLIAASTSGALAVTAVILGVLAQNAAENYRDKSGDAATIQAYKEDQDIHDS